MAKDRLRLFVYGQTPRPAPRQIRPAARETRPPATSRILDAKPVPISGGCGAMLLLFHHALQGMLVLARKIHHLRHLGLGDLVGEYSALPDSMMMDVEHDLGRGFDILLKELLQNVNDKLHWRVVVVQDQDTVEIRTLCLGLDLGDDGCGRPASSPSAVLVVAHSGSKCSDGGWPGRIKFES